MQTAALALFGLVALSAPASAPFETRAARAPQDKASSVAFVPLDDRPVTRQLPLLLGRIAGRPIVSPPASLLGHYFVAGRPDPVIAWLNGSSDARHAGSFVISTDMLIYGGLVASRIPGPSYADAYQRAREFDRIRTVHPRSWIAAFGTIVRLAPTGIPAIGQAASFFAAYPTWKYLQEFANLHDPPLPSEMARAAQLRSLIGEQTLQAYLDVRARNLAVDRLLLQKTARKEIDRIVLGQDDAGPVGLHVKDVLTLQVDAHDLGLGERASIEPGADELGMALVAAALARSIGWTPRIAVRYSMPDGALTNDPLEFAPISVAIDDLVKLCGGKLADGSPDITLYVRVPQTDATGDDAMLAQMQSDLVARRSVAFADLTFLQNTYRPQAAFAERLLSSGVARRLDAYASWNTNANTIGTALAETIAAGVGRRSRTYDALAHREFTFNRIIDDYAFHDYVRPALNAQLDLQGVNDHTYLLPEIAGPIALTNRSLLWNRAAAILTQLYPDDHIAAIQITLPWDRTFETAIDARIAPNL